MPSLKRNPAGAESELDRLVARIEQCRACVEDPKGKPLPHEPRPVVRVSDTARIVIAGQAPGTLVHRTGIPFNDPSGDRLRDWLGVDRDLFYDRSRIAIVPMGFCFPGQDHRGADLPPRRECAPLWREQVFALLPSVELLLTIGQYAHAWHLGDRRRGTLTETVRDWRALVGQHARPGESRRCPIPPGATTPGCAAIRGSRANCCRSCARRLRALFTDFGAASRILAIAAVAWWLQGCAPVVMGLEGAGEEPHLTADAASWRIWPACRCGSGQRGSPAR